MMKLLMTVLMLVTRLLNRAGAWVRVTIHNLPRHGWWLRNVLLLIAALMDCLGGSWSEWRERFAF